MGVVNRKTPALYKKINFLESCEEHAKMIDTHPDPSSVSDSVGDRVAILLSTLNGQQFLPDQLESIRNQHHANWKVWVSDDGSIDSTGTLLDKYRSEWGDDRVTICAGPGRGFVSNFLSLVCNPSIEADYFAFCDQDDIWEPDKLSIALDRLRVAPANIPSLYCSRRLLINESGQEIGFTPLYKVPPSFTNALVQNIAGGNTMVFNKAAVDLLRAAGERVKVVYHDWWTYLLVTGAGGTVYYDPQPTIRYRQHSQNIIGPNTSLLDRIVRLRMVLEGRFKRWNDLNTTALQDFQNYLAPKNRVILVEFISARKRWFLPRLLGIFRSGVHRQTFIGNLGLLAATIIGKI